MATPDEVSSDGEGLVTPMPSVVRGLPACRTSNHEAAFPPAPKPVPAMAPPSPIYKRKEELAIVEAHKLVIDKRVRSAQCEICEELVLDVYEDFTDLCVTCGEAMQWGFPLMSVRQVRALAMNSKTLRQNIAEAGARLRGALPALDIVEKVKSRQLGGHRVEKVYWFLLPMEFVEVFSLEHTALDLKLEPLELEHGQTENGILLAGSPEGAGIGRRVVVFQEWTAELDIDTVPPKKFIRAGQGMDTYRKAAADSANQRSQSLRPPAVRISLAEVRARAARLTQGSTGSGSGSGASTPVRNGASTPVRGGASTLAQGCSSDASKMSTIWGLIGETPEPCLAVPNRLGKSGAGGRGGGRGKRDSTSTTPGSAQKKHKMASEGLQESSSNVDALVNKYSLSDLLAGKVPKPGNAIAGLKRSLDAMVGKPLCRGEEKILQAHYEMAMVANQTRACDIPVLPEEDLANNLRKLATVKGLSWPAEAAVAVLRRHCVSLSSAEGRFTCLQPLRCAKAAGSLAFNPLQPHLDSIENLSVTDKLATFERAVLSDWLVQAMQPSEGQKLTESMTENLVKGWQAYENIIEKPILEVLPSHTDTAPCDMEVREMVQHVGDYIRTVVSLAAPSDCIADEKTMSSTLRALGNCSETARTAVGLLAAQFQAAPWAELTSHDWRVLVPTARHAPAMAQAALKIQDAAKEAQINCTLAPAYREAFKELPKWRSQVRIGATQEVEQAMALYLGALRDLVTSTECEVGFANMVWNVFTEVLQLQPPPGGCTQEVVQECEQCAKARLEELSLEQDIMEVSSVADACANLGIVSVEAPCLEAAATIFDRRRLTPSQAARLPNITRAINRLTEWLAQRAVPEKCDPSEDGLASTQANMIPEANLDQLTRALSVIMHFGQLLPEAFSEKAYEALQYAVQAHQAARNLCSATKGTEISKATWNLKSALDLLSQALRQAVKLKGNVVQQTFDNLVEPAEALFTMKVDVLLRTTRKELSSAIETLSLVAGGMTDGTSWKDGLKDKDWAAVVQRAQESLLTVDGSVMGAAQRQLKKALGKLEKSCAAAGVQAEMEEAVGKAKDAYNLSKVTMYEASQACSERTFL